jgi:cystathionine beta-lyase/cystathionine gamma-synthase
MRTLSPKRNTTTASDPESLVAEQLAHFGVDPESDYGRAIAKVALRLYECKDDVDLLKKTFEGMVELSAEQRISSFNAKKFLAFQFAKLLSDLQEPTRLSYQRLGFGTPTQCAKGPYAVLDNIPAIFSATPVIARTSTYVYACAEWIADAFKGKEFLLDVYSRLLNPTSIALANHIVDLEAGPYSGDYLAWNFNSGMAAIDAVLCHVLGQHDILITSRNVYGGSHQLIFDWYAKQANFNIAVETFDGYEADDFVQCLEIVREKYADRIAEGAEIHVYLESPCNPHGYVLDIPAICRAAHTASPPSGGGRIRVILDATVGTPFLARPLQRADVDERPDFVVHSYTKDLSGTGTVIAGVVIGRNQDMFIPKGETVDGVNWADTMFWNVYYVKGGFLNADAAFEVIQGMRTLEVRMLAKCINTRILTRFLSAHPKIRVHANTVSGNENFHLRERLMFLGLPAPLFTIDMHDSGVPEDAFKRFFDCLSPTFDHQISLGQSNTTISCPGLTTHSELSEEALAAAGIEPTTIRFSIGDEDPKDLLTHFVTAARLAIDPVVPGFSAAFPPLTEANAIIRECYLDTHTRYVDAMLERHGDPSEDVEEHRLPHAA